MLLNLPWCSGSVGVVGSEDSLVDHRLEGAVPRPLYTSCWVVDLAFECGPSLRRRQCSAFNLIT